MWTVESHFPFPYPTSTPVLSISLHLPDCIPFPPIPYHATFALTPTYYFILCLIRFLVNWSFNLQGLNHQPPDSDSTILSSWPPAIQLPNPLIFLNELLINCFFSRSPIQPKYKLMQNWSMLSCVKIGLRLKSIAFCVDKEQFYE